MPWSKAAKKNRAYNCASIKLSRNLEAEVRWHKPASASSLCHDRSRYPHENQKVPRNSRWLVAYFFHDSYSGQQCLVDGVQGPVQVQKGCWRVRTVCRTRP